MFSLRVSSGANQKIGKRRGCGKSFKKEQNKEFTIIYCRRSVSIMENCISGHLYNELFRESNEEKCTAFKRMAWSLILLKYYKKLLSCSPRIFLPVSLFASFISFFIKARILQAFSILYKFSHFLSFS